MPIRYDIETDGLYLEGLEKGEKKGIELQRRKSVVSLLKNGSFTTAEVAKLLGVSEQFVQSVADELRHEPDH